MPIKITHFLKIFYCTTTCTHKPNMIVFNITHLCLTWDSLACLCTRAVNLLHIVRSVEVLLWFCRWHSSPRCGQNLSTVNPAFLLEAPCEQPALHLCFYVFFTSCELVCTPRRKRSQTGKGTVSLSKTFAGRSMSLKTLILVSTLIYGWELKIQQRYACT